MTVYLHQQRQVLLRGKVWRRMGQNLSQVTLPAFTSSNRNSMENVSEDGLQQHMSPQCWLEVRDINRWTTWAGTILYFMEKSFVHNQISGNANRHTCNKTELAAESKSAAMSKDSELAIFSEMILSILIYTVNISLTSMLLMLIFLAFPYNIAIIRISIGISEIR